MKNDFDSVLELWNSARFEEAESAAREFLARNPDRAEVVLILGLATLRRGEVGEAVQHLSRAVELRGDIPLHHAKLADALARVNRMDEGIVAYRRALELDPNYLEARNNLGVQLDLMGRHEEAIAEYRKAIEQRQDYAQPWVNLASALLQMERFAEAIPAAERAVELMPRSATAHRYLGFAYRGMDLHREAIGALREAVRLSPRDASLHYHLAGVLTRDAQHDAAIEALEIARSLNPNSSRTYFALGFNLAAVGLVSQAIAVYRSGLLVAPGDPQLFDNLLFTLQFLPDASAQEMFAEHQTWARRFEAPMSRFIKPHDNAADADRRLRVGYLSPDFRDHCQRLFTIPLLKNHDRASFEIFCYCNAEKHDQFTPRIRALTDQWREVSELREDQIAEQIREDKIDILVDLTMHMGRNRLDVFAIKPAPVQVTWLAYPGTTGMRAIDYRLTDPVLDPPGTETGKYSEESIRLPDTFWCYDAQSEETVSALPADTNGYITFGSLNAFFKMNDRVIALWSRVLNEVARSRMLIMVPSGSARARMLGQFAQSGVTADRIEFISRQMRDAYLRTYHRIDIALDTFPYNGHTTSLDAFWMGVPVVTLVGETIVGRAGLSQLTNLSLTNLAARDADEFVRFGAELAGDLPRLRELRRTLRARMEASPLMDAPRFARNMERAFRDMWKRWCASREAAT